MPLPSHRKLNLTGWLHETIAEAGRRHVAQVFFMLSAVLPVRQALALVKAQLRRTYAHKGEQVIAMNVSAVERIANLDGTSTSPEGGLKRIALPVEWMHIGVSHGLAHAPEIAPADEFGELHASNVSPREWALN
jgi:hypothetical protein